MCNLGMGSMPGTCCGPTGGLGPCLLCGPYNGQWFKSVNHCCGPCGPYGCCSCYGPSGGHC
ncbi:hypothetical protein KR032_010686 [Drosophila birchii]|nr:hypothetical protein KR032_010686 [Drosophila birchii]